MTKFKIEMECDAWWLASSLHALTEMVERDLLDKMENGKVEVSLDHCTATIKESE